MKHLPALAHGPLESIFDGIWFVKGAVKMPMLIPMRISRSMTVVRVAGSDELVLINSMRLSDEGLAALERLGKVSHVIRIGGFHGRDDAFYKERYGAKVYALRGHVYRRAMDVTQPGPTYFEADEYLNADSDLPILGARLIVIGSRPNEGILRLSDHGGVLVTADSLQNTPSPDDFVNLPARVMMKKMGFYHPYLVGPAWLKFGKPTASEVRDLIALEFEHVLPGHGDPVIGSAKEKYLPSINGPLEGARQ